MDADEIGWVSGSSHKGAEYWWRQPSVVSKDVAVEVVGVIAVGGEGDEVVG